MNCRASINDYAKVALKIICTVVIDKGHKEYLFKDTYHTDKTKNFSIF